MRTAFAPVLALLATVSLYAQESPTGGAGIGITLQNSTTLRILSEETSLTDVTGFLPAVTIPIRFGGRAVVEPLFSYWHRSEGLTLWRLGVGVEQHFSAARVSPFAGARVTLFRFSDGEEIHDYLLSAIGGAEYRASDQLTVGGELSLNAYLAEDIQGSFGVNERHGPVYTDAALRVRFFF